tara:strand:- start:5965 stop:6231 length:267 start_codon:yes stop_codon:yes gene_type:complete
MQKIVNIIALASGAVSVAVVGGGLFLFLNRASIVDGVKSQVMEAVSGALPGLVDSSLPEIPSVPSSTGGVMMDAPAAPLSPDTAARPF